jgi:hypothetical protein
MDYPLMWGFRRVPATLLISGLEKAAVEILHFWYVFISEFSPF